MKTGFFFNAIQEVFSRTYQLTTGREPYPLRTLLLREYRQLKLRNLLEVGCGSACIALPGLNYTGIDPNKNYIRYCQQNRPGQFREMSAAKMDFPDGSFHGVVCFSVGHHLPDELLQQVLREIRRVLADDGFFLFADPVRPIVGFRPAAAMLEWLDEGDSFRTEGEYEQALAPHFHLQHREHLVDQFYRTLFVRGTKR